ncbi:hypothetical protein IP88_03995 [alpha proteobacterium AAP81b]|nr:hypothetical protein IP88_03995 [alpha proteobacterium AAP81b]
MTAFLVTGALLALSAGPTVAAEQCRDAKGKFIKCPPKGAASGQRCKDAKGKFAKCGTPGAKPV